MSFKLRDYQNEAVNALVAVKRGFLVAPPGAGKTIMLSAALNVAAKRDQKITWIAMTREQCDQAWTALAKFPRLLEDCDISVCCYAAYPDLSKTDILVCDEAHHCSSPAFAEPIRKIPTSATVWGCSATPFRDDELRDEVFVLTGPIVFEVKREDLLAEGTLAPAEVVFHKPNSDGELVREVEAAAWPEFEARLRRYPKLALTRRTLLKNAFARFDNDPTPENHAAVRGHLEYLANNDAQEQWGRVTWQACQDIAITNNAARNCLITELMVSEVEAGASLMVVVNSIKHGEALVAESGISAEMCHSKMGAGKRKSAVERFRDGSLRCVVGTSLFDEGFDAPRASSLILATGGRSATKTIQRSGRVLRSFLGKTKGNIHDFDDTAHHYLAAQSRVRRRLYAELGYAVLN